MSQLMSQQHLQLIIRQRKHAFIYKNNVSRQCIGIDLFPRPDSYAAGQTSHPQPLLQCGQDTLQPLCFWRIRRKRMKMKLYCLQQLITTSCCLTEIKLGN